MTADVITRDGATFSTANAAGIPGTAAGNNGPDAPERGSGVIIIPCLDEALHIEALVGEMHRAAERLDLSLVVADGGSTDGTLDILFRLTGSHPRLRIMHNARRIQSAAINTAVERFGAGLSFFIRIDAHGAYPGDYCDRLIEDFVTLAADSVTVSMDTRGEGAFQSATAAAQNSRLGNGGSKHRSGAVGHWTDHGHHALMRIAAFRSVGGYDESFSHNEDAELDFRLRAAGHRIWMTGKTHMVYYPRSTVSGLFRQYLGYGRGRAKNLLKHGSRPKPRQLILLAVAPLVAGSLLAVVAWWALIPAAAWAALCMGYGLVLGLGGGHSHAPLIGVSAMVMHFAWSLGFWLQVFTPRRGGGRSA